MKIRATLLAGAANETEVKILMAHEMESGQRKDAAGQTIPAHIITEVRVLWQDKEIFSCEFGTAVSKNPFLSFRFQGGAVGDTITATWTDNRGDSRTDRALIIAASA